jgi:methylmalonyl-CoA/ethylmalonyl-CoA epimerase
MKIELLEPHRVDTNDFLRRFLDQRGPGPHHLTFKVPDIRDALARCETAGIAPVNVDLSDPDWQEAFLHPKAATGVVVQLAQSSGEQWKTPEPAGFPNSRVERPADLVRIVHLVPALDDGLAVFERLLGGQRVDEGGGWVELAWPVDGRVRLVELPEALHGAPGRICEIVFSVDEPAAVAGVTASDDGTWVVSAESNLGTQVRLLPAEALPAEFREE